MSPPVRPRLTAATLSLASRHADTPAFDLQKVDIGVVHLGPGAFFRAHQLDTYEKLLAAGDLRWGVCGVSLRNPDVRDALAPQDGLYTLVRLGDVHRPQVIGALRELLVAWEAPELVLARLASPQTRIVSLTVTEKGYHLDGAGELAVSDPAVIHDLTAQTGWQTPLGWLAAALKARREAGLPPFLTLSCDNLSGNGGKLKRALLTLVHARGEVSLGEWIEAEAQFPNSMVDSITPATDDALRLKVSEALGLWDAWPVQRERFTQWVIEDVGHPALDALATAGVTLTNDVGAFERVKLRLLNGAHSTLAYLGLAAGLETVADAMAEPRLAGFVETLMREDLAPTIRPPEGLAISAYIDAVLARFRETSIRHRLLQIAADGSLKLPIRLLAPAAEALQAAAPIHRFAVPIAAWMRYIVCAQRSGARLEDPAAQRLLTVGALCSDEPLADVDRFLNETGVFEQRLRQHQGFRHALASAYLALASDDPLSALASDAELSSRA